MGNISQCWINLTVDHELMIESKAVDDNQEVIVVYIRELDHSRKDGLTDEDIQKFKSDPDGCIILSETSAHQLIKGLTDALYVERNNTCTIQK